MGTNLFLPLLSCGRGEPAPRPIDLRFGLVLHFGPYFLGELGPVFDLGALILSYIEGG